MKKTVVGLLCATFVVGVVFAVPTGGKKEEPKAAAKVQAAAERTSPMPTSGKKEEPKA
jgi:hypothetical protein